MNGIIIMINTKTAELLLLGVALGGIAFLADQEYNSSAPTKSGEIKVEPIKVEPMPMTPEQKRWLCALDQDCVTIAEATYFEARGESIEGKRGVGLVIMNRVEANHFPDTVTDVVYAQRRGICQFEYVCLFGKKKRKEMIAKNPESWGNSLAVAYDVVSGQVADFTHGADHYFNPKKVKRTPLFAKVYEHVASIGAHEFYRR